MSTFHYLHLQKHCQCKFGKYGFDEAANTPGTNAVIQK